MKTLVIKGRDRLWPTVTWAGSNLSIQYLGSEDDDVTVKETNTIDFEEFFLHLDSGGSIFLTVKPDAPIHPDYRSREETGFRRNLRRMPPELAETHIDRGEGLSALNWESKEIRTWK
jgi:hypothetical protein